MKGIVLCCVLAFSFSALAHDDHAAPTMPKDFEKMKAWVGDWKATSKMGEKEENGDVSFEMTANNTVLMEKLFAKTPHEMVNMYHANGQKTAMTHYCALGNHPEMALIKADDKKMVFEMKGNQGITSKNEPHMHSMTLTMTDANHMTEDWTYWEGGKQKNSTTITLTRK